MSTGAVIVLAVAVGSVLLAQRSSDAEMQVAGVTVEEFAGEDTVDLGEYRGRPLVINAWASWCAPCVEEMPALQQLYEEAGGRIAFLGVNVQDTPEEARRLVSETGVRYDLASDPDGRIFTELGGYGMPTTWLVDEEGRVRERHTGTLSAAELRGLLREHFEL